MKIKGAIFDMDGTLLDSMGMWREFPAYYLNKRGLSVSKEFTDEFMATVGFQEALELMINRFNLPLTWLELKDQIYEVIDVYYAQEVQLRPGVQELLQHFKGNGIPMAVATASPKKAAVLGLGHTGVLSMFEGVFSTEDIEGTAHKSSSPAVYHKALAAIGTSVENTAVFEDSAAAAATARKAGYLVAGIADATEPNQELLKSVSDWYLNTVEEWELHLK